MREETVTLAILSFLRAREFEIVSFDYPGSGSGKMLHPDTRTSKNGGIIPDVIAFRGDLLLILENKDRFVSSDVAKLQPLRLKADYQRDMDKFKRVLGVSRFYFGIGFPDDPNEILKSKCEWSALDVILVVAENSSVREAYGKV